MNNDILGKKIGKLTVLECLGYEKDNGGRNRFYYLCRCDCGEVIKRKRDTLISKDSKIKSCGCYKKEFLSKKRSRHMMSETRFYAIFLGMRGRVNNKNHKKYKHYGGRGISICEDWKEFEGFKKDMYESYLEHIKMHGEKNTTLDRKNVNGNYEKSNCRWATIAEQNGNRQSNDRKFKATKIATGETFIHNNKRAFAREHDICSSHISGVLNGKRKSSYGFTFKYIE